MAALDGHPEEVAIFFANMAIYATLFSPLVLACEYLLYPS